MSSTRGSAPVRQCDVPPKGGIVALSQMADRRSFCDSGAKGCDSHTSGLSQVAKSYDPTCFAACGVATVCDSSATLRRAAFLPQTYCRKTGDPKTGGQTHVPTSTNCRLCLVLG